MWIAGVDVPDDNDDDNTSVNNTKNNANKIHDDEMHPDDIAGLAPTRQQDNNQIDNEIEIVDGQQDQTNNNEEIEIVFEPDEEATDNEEDPEEDEEPDHPEFDRLIQTRSGQVSRPVHKYVTTHQGQGHLNTQATNAVEYSTESAKVIARTINAMNHQFAQTYSLTKGIKTFGKKGRQAAHKEMKQLHD